MSRGFQYHFEWDPKKARANLRKHKVSFEQAAMVFKDPLTLTVYDEDQGEGEERWATLGRSESGPLLVVIHTYLELSETEALIRVISARRATRREQHTYKVGV